ncbi:MAG TPA: galactokinase [Steroidobacteraceae bacterium]|nr:galactokinase [Steroidobacteraceae bacterium]
MTNLDALRKEFTGSFLGAPVFFRAPGRVNLIGEHTDYNAGYVLPAAIPFYTTVAAAARSDRQLRVRSTNYAETLTVALPPAGAAEVRRTEGTHWVDYTVGVATALLAHGVAVGGADLLIHGEVPLGAGLSSSASLEVAVALALSTLAGGPPLDKITLAKLCQRAENEYVGMRCGIMDQFASVFGREGHAVLLDCRSLEHRLVPLRAPGDRQKPGAQIVICNTMVRHHLAGGEYNRRREECELGVRALAQVEPEIETLRDVSKDALLRHETKLDPTIYRRCRHVITENQRVLAAAEALGAADLNRFGRLMSESHDSLRDDFAVSCDELDLMVRLGAGIDGVYGARMTGGGFGGCTVNLVRADAVSRFTSMIRERYFQATGHRPEIYVCEAAEGAAELGA